MEQEKAPANIRIETITTIYDVADRICTQVTDRKSTCLLRRHPAIGKRFVGAIPVSKSVIHDRAPMVGEQACFHSFGAPFITAAVTRVQKR
jgi:hypothetical protein